MLVAENRPRNLSWLHAGPLLFGDWGTSRLYVLGLAFYYTGHASPLYLAVMSVIMAAVAWAYTVVCRCFPDGGGVYAAARQLSPVVSVIGATLLLCDYVVTAALSAVEGFHYFGVSHHWVVPLSVVTIFLLGVVNWFGAKSAGRLALLIAILAIVTSAVLGLLCLPWLPKGIPTLTHTVDGVTSIWQRWESLVRIVLALSGVEAVANMTGLMKQPVAKTARRTIWPVLIEVVLLNMIFGIALNAMPGLREHTTPDYVAYEVRQNLEPDKVPDEVRAHRDTAIRMLAENTAGHAFGSTAGRVFGIITGLVFGLLLLSAVNTAVMAMVSVQFSLSRDKELPRGLARLNYSGVPWIGLIVACVLPTAVLLVEADVKSLGELYAIGVVGAIAINVLSCAANRALKISAWERRGMWALGVFMAGVELTIVVAKPHATIFAGSIVGVVLLMRYALHAFQRPAMAPIPVPVQGWLSELRREPVPLGGSAPRIMLAARGQDQAQYAVEMAAERGATLFAIYVRTLRVLDVAPAQVPRIEDDPDAQKSLGTMAVLARQRGVPFVPIYVTSTDIASEILDYTATFGCDTLIMGKSRRSLLSRRVAGDVIPKVAAALPDEVTLITRASTAKEAHPEVHADVNASPPVPASGEPASPPPAPDTTPGSPPQAPGGPGPPG
jgi:amino acid transporter